MIKHKKVKRIVIAGFMALCLFMGPLASSPKAATTNSGHGTFTQGSYNWIYGGAGSTMFNIGASAISINIRLNAVYNGVLTITISGISSFADVGYVVEGAQINTTSLNQIQLQLYQSQEIDVTVYSTKSYNASQSWTVTVSGSNMSSLGTELTSLRTISSAVTSTTNGLPAIHNDLESVEQAIAGLYSYIDGLEGYVDNVEGLLTSINSLQTYNVPEYKYLAYYQFSRFSQLNTEFHRGNGGYIYDMGPFVKVNSIPTSYIGEYSLAVNANVRDLYVIYYSSYWTPAFNLIDRDGNSVSWTDSYAVYSNDGYSLYYQHYHHTGNVWLGLNILPISNVNGGDLFPVFIGYHIPSEVADFYNFQIDNTYTQLLSSTNNGLTTINNTINGLKSQTITNTDRIVTALQNLQQQVIVNQNSQNVIDMSTNTTNTINQQFQTINNVELNILDGIGTKFNNVTTAIDNSGVISGSVNNTGIGWANYYSGIVLDNLTIVKYPVYIILIGFVLLCLLG